MSGFSHHHHPVTAAESDIDDLDHVSNVVYVRWLQEAAAAHSGSVGWDLAAYKEEGAVFVVRRHEIDYVAAATCGDALVVETWVEWFRPASSLRCYEIRDGDRVLVRAKTWWAFINVDTGRPVRIPERISAAFG